VIESERFVVIGDDAKREFIEQGRGGSGDIEVFDEILYEAIDDTWDRGSEVGQSHGHYIVTTRGRANFSVTLDFGEGHTVVAAGTLPFDGRLGSGRIPLAGGTGRFGGISGEMSVEVVNPKRYSFGS
jgi:hypothetical protein